MTTNFLNSPYSEFHAWSPLILKLSCHSSSVSQNYIELNFFIFSVLLLFPKVKKLKRPIMSMYWCISHLYVEAVAFDYSSLLQIWLNCVSQNHLHVRPLEMAEVEKWPSLLLPISIWLYTRNGFKMAKLLWASNNLVDILQSKRE